ncbi:MAG: 1-(5-phosphoribosyl)-5-[(5-phosphoribosylamino)methylideneamino]imidazole-4-carboxamide isomerase [Deltaproteobacteria bacterium]|nr:MAG: 1-(5-phosphoribosyl)-5-[(5-phosphoribosylamino)methylideneamino]imidazole-4-carboxamide isomerase [Deltaproteobacteria bacterium]
MPPFEVIPAIDLLGGACVRLAQGRYQEATVYDDDPGAVARRFAAHPIRRLHVVDLDAAKTGRRTNATAIADVVRAAVGIPVQLGGGIRSASDVAAALALGVDRVVIGTAALRDPPLVLEAARRHPGRIVVGIDARAGRVAVRGWLETSDARAVDVARRFEDAGVAAIVYTDIERDGMLSGPNLQATAELGEGVAIPVIASGGVRSVEDVRNLAAIAERGVAGVIVGRALYTGAVDLARALEAGAPQSRP